MKRVTIIITAIIVLAGYIAAFAADETPPPPPKARKNKIEFGDVQTGLTLFLKTSPGYKGADPVTWTKLHETEDFKKIWSPTPEGMPISQRIIDKIPTITVSAPENVCGVAPRLLFLVTPTPQEFSDGTTAPQGKLFAYEYNVCDQTGLLSPESMVDQYIAKYGMYDSKDYDRKMIIYKNVWERYRMGVQPYKEKERSGITITVVDDSVFKDIYYQWRAVLRKAGAQARDGF